MRELEEQRRVATERRLHHAAVIAEHAPDLMRRLVKEIEAAVQEYKRRAPLGGPEIEFEALPGEGFLVARTKLPKVSLECRPGYETHLLYCNMARTDDHDSAPQEQIFSLRMAVDDKDSIALSHDMTTFKSLNDVLEFLLKPVLFPAFDPNV
jgi:hypothetical protein